MKKLSLLHLVNIIIFTLALAGCKTWPAGSNVKSISLLPDEYDYYISVPKACDEKLFLELIQNNIPGMTEKDSVKLTGYLSHVYAGINFSDDNASLQAIIDEKINRKYVSKVLNKNNGWKLNKIKADSSLVYDDYFNGEYHLVFPSNKMCCLTNADINVCDFVTTYESLLRPETSDYIPYRISDEAYDFIGYSTSDIKLYTTKPEIFLSQIVGDDLNLQLQSLRATIKSSSFDKNMYDIVFDFDFKAQKFLKASKSIISMAFNLKSSSMEQVSTTQLHVTGITIPKDKIYKMLVYKNS